MLVKPGPARLGARVTGCHRPHVNQIEEVPVPSLYWADTASIGPVQARYWQMVSQSLKQFTIRGGIKKPQ